MIGDMGELYNDLREHRKKQRQDGEDKKIEAHAEKLRAQGFRVEINDPWSLRVYNDKLPRAWAIYYPWKAWFQGPVGSGRGLRYLTQCLRRGKKK